MTSDLLTCPKKITQYLDECLKTFCFSGYSLSVIAPRVRYYSQGGVVSYWSREFPVNENTLFDIGSITKVVATVSVLARLYDRKELDLHSKIKEMRLLDLLTHSSGLKAWLPLFQKSHDFLEWQDKENKGKSVYSDLGFILIHELLKSKFGNIEELFIREVKEPLPLKSTLFNPKKPNPNIVATEYCHQRKRVVQAEVFDENTYSMNGISTHAGLFSTAKDLMLWANEWLKACEGKSTWLSQKTALEFTSKTKGDWALGFDTKSKLSSTLGSAFSGKTFGHLGFTGTSVWIDPETKSAVVFLTNRIHPSRRDERIKQIRPQLHELIFNELKGQSLG